MGEPESGNMHRPLVLIVDDEPGLLQLFSTLIERLSCTVITALGGEEAIGLLDERTPDLLILDLAMPMVSGYDVLRHARGIARLDGMTVMILTARPNMLPQVEALGIDFWVSKPVMPHALMDIVAGALAEKRPGE